MWKMQAWYHNLLLISFLLIIASCHGSLTNEVEKQRVCVIGAGPTGLTSVKQLADHADEFDIVVFEQKSDIGGIWLYNDSIDMDENGLPIQSSIYKYLRINTPKQLMAFPDYRQFYGEDRSCVSHDSLLQYLTNFTDHFNLRQYVQFNTAVEKVTPILGDGDWRTTQWKVRTKNFDTNTIGETICNAVMVCNGHFSKPKVPKITGIETFPGRVLHSHFYRRPEEFAGKTVVLLGAGVSGTDIASELSHFANKIYLSHNHDRINSPQPENIIQVSGVASANGNELTLRDGSKITADDVIFCTGFLYDFDFLDESSKIAVTGKKIQPLYKELVNIEHPSMSLIGATDYASTFPFHYLQARYFVALLQGKVKLPNKEGMIKDMGSRKEFKAYEFWLDETLWAYADELAREAHFEPLPAFYKKGIEMWMTHLFTTIFDFKDSNLQILDDGRVKLIHPNGTFEISK